MNNAYSEKRLALCKMPCSAQSSLCGTARQHAMPLCMGLAAGKEILASQGCAKTQQGETEVKTHSSGETLGKQAL